MADIEKQVRELPRPVMWLGDALGGMITGVHARFSESMLEKMVAQLSTQQAFFGEYPRYLDAAMITLDKRGRERMAQAYIQGKRSKQRNEAFLELFRRH